MCIVSAILQSGARCTALAKTLPVFHDGVCFGILTCYDSTFRGLGAELASLGARVLFIPTNNALPASTAPTEIVTAARMCDIALATENGCWVVQSDVAGVVDGLQAEGSSAITSPAGRTVSTANPFSEDFLVADIGVSAV